MIEAKIVQERKGNLTQIISSSDSLTWEQVRDMFMKRNNLSEPEVVIPDLMSDYFVGREVNDPELIEAAKRILVKAIPDLEQRLPWYETMFDIMDKGKRISHTDLKEFEYGPVYYKLNPEDDGRVTKNFQTKTGLPEETAKRTVHRLWSLVYEFPGSQFFCSEFLNPSQTRYEHVVRVCLYLFAPVRNVVTLTIDKRCADFWYDNLTKEILQPQAVTGK